MSRKKYVCNPYPIFKPPLNRKNRPSFIKYAMKCALNVDVARNELHYTLPLIDKKTGKIISRYRRLNEHRARALRAIVQAMLYHFNIASTLVMASVEQLSDECGLSTKSKSGNKSISRASRLITHLMEPMGLVTCQTVWDKVMSMYIPKIIYLTPLFFMLFDISPKKLERVRKQQLLWINKNLKREGKIEITLSQAETIAKEQHIYYSFTARNSKHIIKKQRKKAAKIVQLEKNSARLYILNSLVKRYSIQELSEMGFLALKKKVNIEYHRLQKLAKG